MKTATIILSGVLALTVAGCTKPKERTAIGAAAGGALGAGLGAIIGSQTGDAGGGLVIGALAGSAGGGVIGNAFQAQEESVRSQNEAIARQERMINAQHAEIEELRRMNSDAIVEKRAALRERGPAPVQQRQVTARKIEPMTNSQTDRARMGTYPVAGRTNSGTTNSGRGLVERDLADQVQAPAKMKAEQQREAEQSQAASLSFETTEASSTDGCGEARTEFASAKAASENPDKLFHLRRALRLCPDNASYHHELGKVYLSLDRKADAEYEFNQALTIDPSHKGAKAGLESAKKSGGRF